MQSESYGPSPVIQGKICRAGFVHLFIANIQIEDGMQSESYGSFATKPRENLARRICTSLERKRSFRMARVQPCANNLVRFASVILGILPFVKLERLTFVDLVTLPFVNLVTLPSIKICS